MGLRAMLDGHHAEPVETPYTDPEDAAADVLETAFNECAETDRGTAYVEDEDGTVRVFDVEVEMVPSVEATELDRAPPDAVVHAFASTRRGGA